MLKSEHIVVPKAGNTKGYRHNIENLKQMQVLSLRRKQSEQVKIGITE